MPSRTSYEASGREYRSRGTPLHDTAGAVSAALVVIYDITGQRQMDAPISGDSEARLKLALDASGMGTFVWHVDEGRGEPDARALDALRHRRGQPVARSDATRP